ncbi:hypothetical protein QUB63_21475 [Microcoleus sp. ARI1-B5]|uniref:hypothetical protein n=1 Tax=unclassified Microcoleus TaxID=2642155 RepID=UPI002FCEC78F
MIQLIELVKLAREFKLETKAIFDRTGSHSRQIPNARPIALQNQPPLKLAL